MKIGKDSVVSIDYKLHLGDGKIIDESEAEDPLIYLHGHEQIVPGLEKALEGRSVGDAFKVTVTPEEGYGEYDPEEVEEVLRSEFPPDMELEAGGTVIATDDDGDDLELLVKEVREKTVVLDANHELAGKTLHFDVSVKAVRAATAEELEHGHVHGEGDEHDHDEG